LNIAIPKPENFNYTPGKGLDGIVDGKEIKVVGPNYLEEKTICINETKNGITGTIVYVWWIKLSQGILPFLTR
jgi:P-type Cu2+ transporter